MAAVADRAADLRGWVVPDAGWVRYGAGSGWVGWVGWRGWLGWLGQLGRGAGGGRWSGSAGVCRVAWPGAAVSGRCGSAASAPCTRATVTVSADGAAVVMDRSFHHAGGAIDHPVRETVRADRPRVWPFRTFPWLPGPPPGEQAPVDAEISGHNPSTFAMRGRFESIKLIDDCTSNGLATLVD
jgi:hypothetical protein